MYAIRSYYGDNILSGWRAAKRRAIVPPSFAQINRGIESAARFLNMHARNGIAAGDLSLAIVLHGSATRSALNDEAHAERFSYNFV